MCSPTGSSTKWGPWLAASAVGFERHRLKVHQVLAVRTDRDRSNMAVGPDFDRHKRALGPHGDQIRVSATSQPCAPSGLKVISRTDSSIESTRQPSAKARRTSSWRTRLGPQSPGCRSLKQSMK